MNLSAIVDPEGEAWRVKVWQVSPYGKALETRSFIVHCPDERSAAFEGMRLFEETCLNGHDPGPCC